MSLFGPISRPLLDEKTAPVIRRLLQHARMVGNFASVQVLVQLIGFASGILLVRWLDQNEIRLFHDRKFDAGTINVLADMGLLFNLISAVPHLPLNAVLSYRGFRTFQPAS